MKKKLIIACLIIAVAAGLCACTINTSGQTISGNRITSGPDVNRFDYAWVYLGGTLIAEGKVEQWRDYSNSDTVQVVIDGKYYLTHYTNVVLQADVNNRVGYTLVEE